MTCSMYLYATLYNAYDASSIHSYTAKT